MTEWLYKATTKKVSFEETRDLALRDGFLARSAFEPNGSRADNTKHVKFGDIIHMYFTDTGGAQVIGSFQVIGPNRHAVSARFVRGVPQTALLEVDDDFAKRVTSMGNGDGDGYGPDPVLKRVTGWALMHRPDVETPPFSAAAFPNQATLVRRSA